MKNKSWSRAVGVATYAFFGIACLLIGFFGNSAYTEKRLAELADPDQYWGLRAQFYQAPSFGGTIVRYVPRQSITVRRDSQVYKFQLVDTTRFIMKPDVTDIAPGADVQVKYRDNAATGQKVALTVRLLSRSEFK